MEQIKKVLKTIYDRARSAYLENPVRAYTWLVGLAAASLPAVVGGIPVAAAIGFGLAIAFGGEVPRKVTTPEVKAQKRVKAAKAAGKREAKREAKKRR